MAGIFLGQATMTAPAQALYDAVRRGGGGQAQFSHPDLGGIVLEERSSHLGRLVCRDPPAYS